MDPEGAARVGAYVEDAVPGLDPEPVAFETCLYTNTPDEDFVLDARARRSSHRHAAGTVSSSGR